MVTIDAMQPDDWPEVAAIYREGIDSGLATFEVEVPTWAVWNAAHRLDCRLVARDNGSVLGWAALTAVSARSVYAGVADVSLYVRSSARRQGVGRRLLTALIEASEAAGIWTLQAGIFRENAASLALHRACGFREVGFRERIGQLQGVWHDTILMERRSAVVGT